MRPITRTLCLYCSTQTRSPVSICAHCTKNETSPDVALTGGDWTVDRGVRRYVLNPHWLCGTARGYREHVGVIYDEPCAPCCYAHAETERSRERRRPSQRRPA